MNLQLFRSWFLNEPVMYRVFCTGIVYSLFFWPLGTAILCISLATYWLLFCRKQRLASARRSRLPWLFMALYLVFVAGLAFSGNQSAGLDKVRLQLPLLLFPVVFYFTRSLDDRTCRFLVGHYVLAAALNGATGLLFGIASHPGSLLSLTADGRNLLFPQGYPYLMALECLVAVLFLAERELPAWLNPRRIRLPLLLFLIVYVFLLNVRLVSVCTFVLVLYYLLRALPGRTVRALTAAGLIGAAIFMIARVPFFSSRWKELTGFSQDSMIPLDRDASLGRDWGGTAIRVAIWRCSKNLILRHPLTGVGTGDVQDSLQQAYADRQFYFAAHYNRYNVHNQYLHMMLVAGIGGLITLLAGLLIPLFTVKGGPLARVRPVFLVLFCLICCTEVVLDTSNGAIWYSFLNSLLVFGGGKPDV